MKELQLKKIIRESIKQLMAEQSGQFITQPFFNLANSTTGNQSTQFVGNMITAIINKHPQGKGCQFVCNRLNHFVNKYNTKVGTGATSTGAGAAQGGFANTNQGQILSSKINYLANLGVQYNYVMSQALPGQGINPNGGCGCPSPSMLQ